MGTLQVLSNKIISFLNALVVGVRCALSREKVNFCVRADKR